MNMTKKRIETRSTIHTAQLATENNLKLRSEFCYLGVRLTSDGSEDAEIHEKNTLANRTYFALTHIFQSRNIHKNTNITVDHYKTISGPYLRM